MTAPTETKTPRLKTEYRSEVILGASGAVQVRQPHAGSRPGQGRREHGCRRGCPRRQADRRRGPDLTTITGQKPLVRRATKSIAQFKLREGMPIGAKVTLRNDRMWEFLDRLLSIALPRIRDFRGLTGASSTVTATTRSV